MLKTKLTDLMVICENCNKMPHPMFINNKEKHECEICGLIKTKVMYIENFLFKENDENQKLGELFN